MNDARLIGCIAGALVMLLANGSFAETTAPAYRDVLIYGRSHAADAGHVVGELVLQNRTDATIAVRIELDAQPALRLTPIQRDITLAPGDNVVRFTMEPRADLRRATIRGRLWLGDAEADAADRELHVAVHGPDPDDADIDEDQVLRVSEPAQIVAVHAPRTLARARELLEQWQRERAQAEVVLASQGESKYVIELQPLAGAADAPADLEAWLAGDRNDNEREFGEAVGDLVRVIETQSGATLPVTAQPPDSAAGVIEIARVDDPADWPHPDAYRLTVEADGDVRLRATTLTGLRNGIYGLLTEHLGAFWFQPGELGEEILIPDDRTVRVARVDELRSPAFFSTTGMSWGHAPRWDRRNRNRVHDGRMSFGHAWHRLISPEEYPYDEYPDMWARDRDGNVMVWDKGWSFTQFCSTHPRVIEIVAEKTNAYFDRNPDAIVASLDPNDLAPLCLCDRCLALDHEYGIEHQDGQHMADRLLDFSRQIHERLDPAHQNKYVGILAYAAQTNLPVSAEPHAHHATTVCQFPPLFDHSRPFTDPTSPWTRRFNTIVEGWAGMTTQTGFYDYYGHYNYFGPWAIVHKLREDLRAFREAGGTFLVVEAQPNFGMQGLNHYIASQVIWRPNADVDLLLAQFYQHYYGPAADPMQRFLSAAERHFALQRPGTDTHLRVAANPAFWSELESHLASAEAAVKDASVPQRFVDRIAFHRDAFTFADLMYQLDYQYVPLRAPVEDVDASLAFVREHRETFERLRQAYPRSDEYWPPLVAPYFHRPIDRMIETLEALKEDPTRSREVGEALDSIGG